jgi:hypothetical protein
VQRCGTLPGRPLSRKANCRFGHFAGIGRPNLQVGFLPGPARRRRHECQVFPVVVKNAAKAFFRLVRLNYGSGPEAVFGECLLQPGLSWHYSTAIIRS